MSRPGFIICVKPTGKMEMCLHDGPPPLWLINEMGGSGSFILHPWWMFWRGEKVSVMRSRHDPFGKNNLNAVATEWLLEARKDPRNDLGMNNSDNEFRGPIIIMTGGCCYA
jgi:hypothetical protein